MGGILAFRFAVRRSLPAFFGGLVVVMGLAGQAWAQSQSSVVVTQQDQFVVAADQSYVLTRTMEVHISDAQILAEAGIANQEFDPTDETLELVEAWVVAPDGTRTDVPRTAVFTRPSSAPAQDPGFTGMQTTTVEFPGLQVGSVTHSKWIHTVKARPFFGFDVAYVLGLEGRVRLDATIKAPMSLPLTYRQRDSDFQLSDTNDGTTRTISLSIQRGAVFHPEPNMVSPADVGPAFVISALSGYEAMGALVYQQTGAKGMPTPEITALAKSIVADKTGAEAARAIHDWVAQRIRYVAVFLKPSDDFVPPDPATVLANGYSDCKGHSVLMQALLAAVGIRSELVLVNWSNQMRPLPLWSSSSFNHMMVYLPDLDVYANPTNPFAAFGALDMTLSGKMVVVIGEKGEVRSTPVSTPEQNRYSFDAQIGIDASGLIKGTAKGSVSPRIDTPLRQAMFQEGAASVAARLLLLSPEGGYGTISSSDPRDLSQGLTFQSRWTSPHGVVLSAPSIYMSVPFGIDPVPFGAMRTFISPDGVRRFPLMIGAKSYSWTHVITLPEGAVSQWVPQNVDLSNAAGQLAVTYLSSGQTVTVTRKLVVARDIFEPAAYPALQELLYSYLDAQRATMVYKPAP